jgi:predicted metal-dependent enzyme (double-stranded beta helix superfamily)
MNKWRWMAGLGVVAVMLVALRLSSAAEEDLDSLKVCRETQKLIFENAFVRVIDDVIPPGVTEPKHRHPHGVVVTLVDADIESKVYPEGRETRGHSKFGNVGWSEPTVHEVHNVGTAASHFIRIDVK